VRWQGPDVALPECTECPEGLSCSQGQAIVPDDDSIWHVEGVHLRIWSCPPGFLVHRSDDDLQNAMRDKCFQCPPRTYSLERSYYHGVSGAVVNGQPQPDLTFFGDDSTVGKCLSCPDKAICDGGNHIVPQPNNWKGSPELCVVNSEAGEEVFIDCQPAVGGNDTDVFARRQRTSRGNSRNGEEAQNSSVLQLRLVQSVFRCPAGVCKAWNDTTNDNCREGHAGVACASCRAGYVLNKGKCEVCSISSSAAENETPLHENPMTYGMALVFGSLAMGVYYYLSWRPLVQSLSPNGSLCSWEEKCFYFAVLMRAAPCLTQFQKLANYFTQKADFDSSWLRGIFKILAGFLQILGSFLDSFTIEWPSIFDKLWGLTSLLQFDMFSVPNTACALNGLSYFDHLLFRTLLPMGLVVALAIPSVIAALIGLIYHGGAKKYKAWDQISSKFYSSTNLILFLVYPSTSSAVLRAFNCRDYGVDGLFLVDDHRVDCTSTAYTPIMVWAFVCTLVYPIGIPGDYI